MKFFARCGLFAGFVVCLFFMISGFRRDDALLALQNLGEALFLLLIFMLSLFVRNKKLLHILGLTSISLLFLFDAYWGVGGETSLIWSLILPLVFAFYRGQRRGLYWLASYTLLLLPTLYGLFPFLPYSHGAYFANRFLIAYILIACLSFSLEYSRARQHEFLSRYNSELLNALREIKFLQGIIPVCSYCKKVRDDEGYWDQVEKYLARHSNVLISHSICPDCLVDHFPEESEIIREELLLKDKGKG